MQWASEYEYEYSESANEIEVFYTIFKWVSAISTSNYQ